MNLEEAKSSAQQIANKLNEATSVIPYGKSFVVETQANAHANGLRRVFDAFPATLGDPRNQETNSPASGGTT